MSMIGEHALGGLARRQLEEARRDPRLDRGPEATIADFWAAMEEAERVRMNGVWGLHELAQSLEREEAKHGVSRHDPDASPEVRRALQAAWERAEMAKFDLEHEHPHLNAQALLSMQSALDALVEDYVPFLRRLRSLWIAEQIIDRGLEAHPEVSPLLTDEMREHLREALARFLREEKLPKLKRMIGVGLDRYEAHLAQESMAAPADRPIPADLAQALTELGALRNVLMHRGGRVDLKALGQAPTLPYSEGQLVRLTRDDYRRYSAAVRCYASEITFRPMRHWPDTSDEKHGPDLKGWRGYYRVNA